MSQGDTLKVSGLINNNPKTKHNTTVTISPVNFIVSELQIKQDRSFLIGDKIIEPVNGQIEIEYGEEYIVNVLKYTDTYSKNVYINKEDSGREFHWHLEYQKYDKTTERTDPKIGKSFNFKLEKDYLADNNLKLCVRISHYDDIYTLELKVKFKFEFDRKTLVTEVNNREKNPELIRQPGPLCGIAAPCYIWAKHHFEEYAETVLELHAMGKIKVNDFTIDPDSHLYKLKTSKIGNYKSADWVLMASIRDSENTFIDYGDTDDDLPTNIAGVTPMSTVKKLVEKMCKYSIIEEDGWQGLFNKVPVVRWSIDKTKKYINNMDDYYINNKYESLMMIDSDLIDDEPNISPDYHWVVYEGNLVKSDDRAKFDVYSWGSNTTYKVDDSYERIRRNWYQYLVVKCEK